MSVFWDMVKCGIIFTISMIALKSKEDTSFGYKKTLPRI